MVLKNQLNSNLLRYYLSYHINRFKFWNCGQDNLNNTSSVVLINRTQEHARSTCLTFPWYFMMLVYRSCAFVMAVYTPQLMLCPTLGVFLAFCSNKTTSSTFGWFCLLYQPLYKRLTFWTNRRRMIAYMKRPRQILVTFFMGTLQRVYMEKTSSQTSQL